MTEMDSRKRSIVVVTTATVAGVIAGIISSVVLGTTPTAAQNPFGVGIVVALVLVQIPFLHALGVNTDDFGLKDRAYIAFLNFSVWFISYGTILMTV